MLALRSSLPGVATGLAWTPVGGDILFIEATRMAGSGKLILTGQLGDVMKESASAALSVVRARTERRPSPALISITRTTARSGPGSWRSSSSGSRRGSTISKATSRARATTASILIYGSARRLGAWAKVQ